MINIIIKIIALLIILVGVILIYDARIITKKFFSFGDQNDGALGLKVTGFLIIVIGAILAYCNI